jgi:hypothetical protein
VFDQDAARLQTTEIVDGVSIALVEAQLKVCLFFCVAHVSFYNDNDDCDVIELPSLVQHRFNPLSLASINAYVCS